MSKYYQVIKDHPLWEVGAILVEDDDGNYKAIEDIWTKELKGDKDSKNWTEGAILVENQPEWFMRVYPVKFLGKAKYLSKEAARKAHDNLYKEK